MGARTISQMQSEYVQCIRNLSPSQRGQITAAMYHCAFWTDIAKSKINESIDMVSRLLQDEDIKEHAPRVTIVLNSLQMILEHSQIVRDIGGEY